MSTPEPEFDLEKLFLPAWAKESPQVNRYAKYEGDADRGEERERRGDRMGRPPRRRPPPGGGGSGAPSSSRRVDRPRGARPPFSAPGRGRGREPMRAAAPMEPLAEVQVAFSPEELGVDMLAKQIRITGRAYPLFEIAQLVLQKPERHTVTFSVKKRPDGTTIQPLLLCALDDTLWLAEDDAVRHIFNRHFNTFYQAERTKIDPPKGVYTFVAQCGLSGVILGPPNYHDYQNRLRKLHAERFARMPFDSYKARVKIVKDDEVVKKWVEDQSWKTEYLCLNLPEVQKVPTLEEVEKHFRQTHLANIIKPVETHRMNGPQSRNLRDRQLMRLLRQRWEEQKRFPLQIATTLSQQFAARGLQFFKVNKTVTHVAVARPDYLDLEATPVSDRVRRIVEFINGTPKCTHKQLLESLASTPATTSAAAASAPPADPAAPAAESSPVSAVTPPASPEPSPEMTALMTDLHWLIHQGHVIEFANGVLEVAKKPAPKPPKPPKPAPPTEARAAAATAAAVSATVAGASESVVSLENETPGAAAPATEAPAQEAPPVESSTMESATGDPSLGTPETN